MSLSNFVQLVYNEIIKIYIRRSTWIMYGIIALLVVSFGILNKEFDEMPKAGTYADDWREVLTEENKALEKKQIDVEEELVAYDEEYGESKQDENSWDEDRIDIEMSAPDMSIVEQNNIYLDNDTKPSGYGAWQFVADSMGILIVVTLLTIIVASSIVAHEFRWGTIKLLLIRPISRTKILCSKYVAVLLFALATVLYLIIFSWISGAILFGIEDKSANMLVQVYGDGDAAWELVSTYKNIIQSYGYSFIELVMMVTFAFMISTVFRNSTLAVGAAIFLTFAGTVITVSLLAFEKNIAKYLLFTHIDLSQYTQGAVFIEGMTIGFSIMILAIYYVLFLFMSWISFVKRDVT